MHEIFYTLAQELLEKQIKVMLIGGHSMQFYDHQRLTADTDWLICNEAFDEIAKMLKLKGYKQADLTPAFARYSHPLTNAIDLDLMLVDRKTFDSMWQRGTTHQQNNTSWRVPHPEDMIALKLHAIKNNPKRELEDLTDIVSIARFAGAELSAEKLRELCRIYANEELYARIKDKI